MAIESAETLDTTSATADNDLGHRVNLRRRPSARAADPAPDWVSNFLEAESTADRVESDQNDANLTGGLYGEAADSVSGEQGTESASEGLSCDNKVEEQNAKEKGENINGKGLGALAVDLAYRPSAPVHRKIKESPLSSAAIFKQSHAGLFNLCIVVLVAVNGRLIIENLMKYGWLIKTGFWFSSTSLRDWPLFMCWLSLPIFPVAAFLVEKLVRQKFIPEWVSVFLHIIIITAEILYPVVVILRCDSSVQSGATLMLFACILWLKLVSYAHTNYDLRALVKSDKLEALSSYWGMEYSSDVSFKSLAYFTVAPTLCYQPSYPRTPCIRKSLVARQFIEYVMITGLMGLVIEQYINPIVKNSQHPLKGDLLYAIERVLKLSLPTLYVWLCMFYGFFHVWLNALAELLRFGDREFYKDWWNARTVDEYWRKWNMPVHKWMVRHIYIPCLKNGIPKGVALVIAFFVSAVFHELYIGVPCHIWKFWLFFGIMLQVPLVIVTNYLQQKFKNPTVGNMFFWCFFCIVGQPMCVLLYYHDMMNRKAE